MAKVFIPHIFPFAIRDATTEEIGDGTAHPVGLSFRELFHWYYNTKEIEWSASRSGGSCHVYDLWDDTKPPTFNKTESVNSSVDATFDSSSDDFSGAGEIEKHPSSGKGFRIVRYTSGADYAPWYYPYPGYAPDPLDTTSRKEFYNGLLSEADFTRDRSTYNVGHEIGRTEDKTIGGDTWVWYHNAAFGVGISFGEVLKYAGAYYPKIIISYRANIYYMQDMEWWLPYRPKALLDIDATSVLPEDSKWVRDLQWEGMNEDGEIVVAKFPTFTGNYDTESPITVTIFGKDVKVYVPDGSISVLPHPPEYDYSSNALAYIGMPTSDFSLTLSEKSTWPYS